MTRKEKAVCVGAKETVRSNADACSRPRLSCAQARFTLPGTGHRPVYVVVGSSSQAVSSQQQQQQQRQRQQSRWAGSGIPRRARVSGTHRHVVHSGNKGEVSRGRSPRPARTFWLTRGGLDQSFRYVHESKIFPKILILDIFQC